MKIVSSIPLALAIFISAISSVLGQPAGDISQANNRFAFDIYSRLDAKQGNIFFSPYSLSSALTMTYEGARNQTADEMRMALYLPSDEVDWRTDLSDFIKNMNMNGNAYTLNTANALWIQKGFLLQEDYLKSVKDIYFGEVRNLDFVANPEPSRITINTWVSGHTQHRINDLLPAGSINSGTRLVLTDAVYFKGKWVAPFMKRDTKPDTFWLNPAQSVQTDMMMLSDRSFYYASNDHVQLLELPYQGNDLSMLIILPRSKDIQGLEKDLTLDMLKQWQGEMTIQRVKVFIPKFEIDESYEMSGLLSGMGMKQAFDPNHADFSGMADKTAGGNLYIDKVFHKAWIDTDEEGTEAAAATAVVVSLSTAIGPAPEPNIFRADHPFILVIQENKTGHILFMGRVSDPREK